MENRMNHTTDIHMHIQEETIFLGHVSIRKKFRNMLLFGLEKYLRVPVVPLIHCDGPYEY